MRLHLVSGVALILAASGCANPEAPDSLGLLLHASTVGTRIQLSARLDANNLVYIVAHNRAAVPDTLVHGGCAFAARIYAGAGSSAPVWQSIPSIPQPCPLYLAVVPVAPGDSVSILVAQLDGGGAVAVPPGGEVRAYINANGQLQSLVAGQRIVNFPSAAR